MCKSSFKAGSSSSTWKARAKSAAYFWPEAEIAIMANTWSTQQVIKRRVSSSSSSRHEIESSFIGKLSMLQWILCGPKWKSEMHNNFLGLPQSYYTLWHHLRFFLRWKLIDILVTLGSYVIKCYTDWDHHLNSSRGTPKLMPWQFQPLKLKGWKLTCISKTIVWSNIRHFILFSYLSDSLRFIHMKFLL